MTTCPHGNGPPIACSQCRGAVPRRVTFDADRRVLIDGVPEDRGSDAEPERMPVSIPPRRRGPRR